ncbi:hypothetical protein P7K49_031200 [Saguinus oedipus]|uniref:Translation elongation factor EF1B beta/delta subunit guanine nucleotide exchange domain-containing protein n=1 Tax=Saguinus oedipus TaxID=9490 RepID=A0ABQ9U4G9_SAGOE|nr:hypothetical protein P7K49_031200 [Saguinus oedipus]
MTMTTLISRSDDEEESEEAKRLREEGLAQYESKKAKRPALVAKSSILLDCVVEDDEVGTDMLEEQIAAFEDYVQSMDVAAFNKI